MTKKHTKTKQRKVSGRYDGGEIAMMQRWNGDAQNAMRYEVTH